MFIGLHRFQQISIDFNGFLWIFIDLKSSGARVLAARCHPVAPCGGLWRPVAPDWIPLILRFQILEAWIWRPGAWMPGCWKDWNGLEEVTEVTAFWGEGIGRNSHTLKLQELGGYGHGQVFATQLVCGPRACRPRPRGVGQVGLGSSASR